MKLEMSKTDTYYHIRIPVLESYHSKYLRKFLDWLRLREISLTTGQKSFQIA